MCKLKNFGSFKSKPKLGMYFYITTPFLLLKIFLLKLIQTGHIKVPSVSLSHIVFVILITLSSGSTMHAHCNTVDSLYSELSNTTKDLHRITIMEELVSELINSDLQQALKYAEISLALSKEIEDKEKQAIALNNLGLVLDETDDREKAFVSFKKSLNLSREINLKKLEVNNLMSIAKYHRYVSKDSTKVVKYFLESAAKSKTIDYHYATGRSYAKLASFYTRYNQVNLCEQYLEMCAPYYKKSGGHANNTIAHYYNEVGNKIWHLNPRKSMDLFFKGKEYSNTPNLMVSLAKAYHFIGDYSMALKYLKQAIPYFEKTEDRRRMRGIAMGQLAQVYFELGLFDLALETCNIGIDFLKNVGRSDQRAIPVLYRVKGMIMERDGNDEEAMKYITKSRDEASRIKVAYERIESNIELGFFYIKRDIKKGKKSCEKALKDSRKSKHTNLEVKACECLYQIYKMENSFAKALDIHEQKIVLTDSLSTMKVQNALEINAKISEKDKLLAEQAFQKEIKDKELKNQYLLNRSLLLSIVLGGLLIGFLTISHRRIKKKNNEINEKTNELIQVNNNLEKSNEELARFAHIASHDLKSPLRNILNFTGLLKVKLEKEDQEINNWLHYINSSGIRMNRLIEDLLEFSKLSSNNENKAKDIINLNDLVDEIVQFTQYVDGENKVKFDIEKLPQLNWYHSKIFLLFKNLIENGIKYNQSKHPSIKIFCTNKMGINTICVQDNGIGIKEEYFDKIFVMFNRLHTQGEYEGTGLGLATCKKIVEEFEGKISVVSLPNVGTTFKIELPANLINYQINTKNETPMLVEK